MNDEQKHLLAGGLLKISEAAELTGLGKSKLYNLMDEGKLQFVMIDRSRRIPKNALLEFIAENLRGGRA